MINNVAVVIPHYGDDEMLGKCIAGVNACGIDSKHIFVKDNNKKNDYFTRSINSLIIKALGTGDYDYIWVLNNDTYPESEYVNKSIAMFGKQKACGIVGGKNLIMDNPDIIFWGGSKDCFPAGKHKQGLVSLGDLDSPTKEPWATFSSVIIKRKVFEIIGLLDGNMIMTESDSDFCLRARMAGFEIWYQPEAVIYHKVGASSNIKNLNNKKINRIMHQDKIYFECKWISGKLYYDLERELL